jgi:hypothetical protein
MPQVGGALCPPTPSPAASVAAVGLAPIAPPAHEEELLADATAGLPKAVLHESPSERAGKLSSVLGACETGRASARCRAPEGPGSHPGPSFFRRAAWARFLSLPLALENFLAAHPRRRLHDVRDRNLRIEEAINTRRGGAPALDHLVSAKSGLDLPPVDFSPTPRPPRRNPLVESLRGRCPTHARHVLPGCRRVGGSSRAGCDQRTQPPPSRPRPQPSQLSSIVKMEGLAADPDQLR